MPEAESFNALGAGNGFPFCPTRVDVDGYDYWTTFSGFNENSGGSPSEADINDSLVIAMNIFWNLYKMNATIVSTPATGQDLTDVFIVESFADQSSDPIEPGDRVCSNVLYNRSQSSNTNNEITFRHQVARMYFNNEFIGYGSETQIPSGQFSVESLNNSGVIARLFMGGYGDTPSASSSRIDDIEYVTISGASYVCVSTATDGAVYTSSVDASNLTASCSYNFSSAESTVTITGFEFYTY